jgi:hypothetical protein
MMLESGYDIFISDADVVWFDNPWPVVGGRKVRFCRDRLCLTGDLGYTVQGDQGRGGLGYRFAMNASPLLLFKDFVVN